jgi:hypothetical protein
MTKPLEPKPDDEDVEDEEMEDEELVLGQMWEVHKIRISIALALKNGDWRPTSRGSKMPRRYSGRNKGGKEVTIATTISRTRTHL